MNSLTGWSKSGHLATERCLSSGQKKLLFQKKILLCLPTTTSSFSKKKPPFGKFSNHCIKISIHSLGPLPFLISFQEVKTNPPSEGCIRLSSLLNIPMRSSFNKQSNCFKLPSTLSKDSNIPRGTSNISFKQPLGLTVGGSHVFSCH